MGAKRSSESSTEKRPKSSVFKRNWGRKVVRGHLFDPINRSFQPVMGAKRSSESSVSQKILNRWPPRTHTPPIRFVYTGGAFGTALFHLCRARARRDIPAAHRRCGLASRAEPPPGGSARRAEPASANPQRRGRARSTASGCLAPAYRRNLLSPRYARVFRRTRHGGWEGGPPGLFSRATPVPRSRICTENCVLDSQ